MADIGAALSKCYKMRTSVEWTFNPLRMRYVFYVNDKATLLVQTNKPSESAEILPTVMRGKATFTAKMESLVRYAQDFKEKYGVRFVDVHISDILEDMM